MRNRFSNRLGFLFMSAGCAIGLGNVWRFPHIVGQYGGGAFVLIYLFFLMILGLPIMVMEYAVGRASQKSAVLSFDVLEPKGSHWHWMKWIAYIGNILLMMFYTTVCGWMLYYFYLMLSGHFDGASVESVNQTFGNMLQSPFINVGYMALVVGLGFFTLSKGFNNGVEKVSKFMMTCLLSLMLVLAFRSVTLPGAVEGLKYYLIPNFNKIQEVGISEVVFAAMAQAFFTLSLGIGAIAIFGSYIDKERRLTGEALQVVLLDTFVAIISGLIVIPACFAYGVDAGQGPGLIFVSLPNIFSHMAMGRIWGTLFFLFLSFAAFTTIIAVFQNIVDMTMDLTSWSLEKTIKILIVVLFVLSLPCALGFNVWSGIQPMGSGSTIQDLEDFVLSNNLLPLGTLVYVLFSTWKQGWGWNAFLEEANSGKGLRFPSWVKIYCSYAIPLIILFIFIQGYVNFFHQ